jgi:hypothetical protein
MKAYPGVTRGLRMQRTLHDILGLYDPSAPLEQAFTIPAPWYRDPRVAELERSSAFRATWQVVGRADQVRDKVTSSPRMWRVNRS